MKIATFIKFGKLEHLEELRKGILYMNPLSYFKNLKRDTARRSDSNEGLSAVYQPDQIKIVFKIDGKEHEITELAGPVIVTNGVGNAHAFCLFALTAGDYEVEDQVYDDDLLKIKLDEWSIPDRYFTLYTGDIVYTFAKPKGSSTGSTLVPFSSK